jgi:hypothetical protein
MTVISGNFAGLLSQQKGWFLDAETDIATICVTYLSFNVFETGICQDDMEFEERLQSYPLYDYASHNWGHHARQRFMLIPEVVSFLETKGPVEASSQALFAWKSYSRDLAYSQRFARQMTGLHLAAYFGVEIPVNVFYKIGPAAGSEDSYGRTPLSWAAENGRETVVQVLLDNGAEVDAKDGDGRTPLS